MWPPIVTVTGGRLPEPSAATTSSGTSIPVAVLPPSSTVARNLMGPSMPPPAGPVPAAASTAAANSLGASSGEKWPAPSSQVRRASAKKSPIRSDHSRGNSGSYSGHSTVVGTVIRSCGAGAFSASEAATDPAPARYQAIEAVNAPGGP